MLTWIQFIFLPLPHVQMTYFWFTDWFTGYERLLTHSLFRHLYFFDLWPRLIPFRFVPVVTSIEASQLCTWIPEFQSPSRLLTAPKDPGMISHALWMCSTTSVHLKLCAYVEMVFFLTPLPSTKFVSLLLEVLSAKLVNRSIPACLHVLPIRRLGDWLIQETLDWLDWLYNLPCWQSLIRQMAYPSNWNYTKLRVKKSWNCTKSGKYKHNPIITVMSINLITVQPWNQWSLQVLWVSCLKHFPFVRYLPSLLLFRHLYLANAKRIDWACLF